MKANQFALIGFLLFRASDRPMPAVQARRTTATAPSGNRTRRWGTRFRYTGQQYLSQLGRYDYEPRSYSPMLGRFLQVDPIGLRKTSICMPMS
ncbi:MAG: hypothetical protein JNK96_01800 [Betaproteobacteria bacterium]|nr:hypothetical protein [Betaproteobacteria bacterium]